VIRTYRQIGRCIYCGGNEDLSTEHVIPYGLGGTWTLGDASCVECRTSTGRFEQGVLRQMMGVVRAATDMPTRRPAERPARFDLLVERAGTRVVESVTVRDHLVLLPLPIFPPPRGKPRPEGVGDIQVRGSVTLRFGSDDHRLALRYADSSIKVTIRYKPSDFARMLAKIAYCYSVLQFGLNGIAEPTVVPVILGRDADIGRWVGTDENEAPPLGANDLHRIQTDLLGENITAAVRLFASSPSPTYEVIVGRASGETER
jgi:hypothetical protein